MVMENTDSEIINEAEQSEEEYTLSLLELRDLQNTQKKDLMRQVKATTEELKTLIPTTDSMEDGFDIGEWKVHNREVRIRRVMTNESDFRNAVRTAFIGRLSDPNEFDENNEQHIQEMDAMTEAVWNAVRVDTTQQRFRQRRRQE